MKIMDKRHGRKVDVCDADCPRRSCYWARLDPGSFTQGRGYQYRSDEWLCGNREIHGCPQPKPEVKP